MLDLASQLYPSHTLTAADAHTIQCVVTGDVTYVPIPAVVGENLAGLFTIDLPDTVVAGQEFDVTVRRIGWNQALQIEVQRNAEPGAAKEVPAGAAGAQADRPGVWRYVIGTFQVNIPVTTADVMLFPEENTLAIMKWRLEQLAASDRWYPVLQRYISYISARVAGLGGNPASIPASPSGAPIRGPEPGEDLVEYRGKISEVIFDCFGDFEGFILVDCCSAHSFVSRERGIREIALRACQERFTLAVFVSRNERTRIRRLVIRS